MNVNFKVSFYLSHSRCLILSRVKSLSALGEVFNFWSYNRIEQNNVFKQVSSTLPAIWLKKMTWKNESLPYLLCADPFLLWPFCLGYIYCTFGTTPLSLSLLKKWHIWFKQGSDLSIEMEMFKTLIQNFSLQVNHCHRRWPWLSYWHCCMSVNFLRDTALLTWRSNWGQRSSRTLASPRQIPSKGFVLRKVYRNFKCKDEPLCLCHRQCCYF